MNQWLLNGQLISVSSARHEAVFQEEYKSGVFETFRSFSGCFWQLSDHFVRLQNSAQLLGLIIPIEIQEIQAALTSLVDLEVDYRYKFWTNGVDWWIKVLPLDGADFSQGIVVVDQVFSREMAEAKYGAGFYPMSREYAQAHAAFEVLWFNVDDVLLEGSITNVFAVIDGQLCTPCLGGILPGLMRDWVLQQNVLVLERDIARAELLQADEIFCTNMVRGILPVSRWGTWKSGSFQMSRILQEALDSDLPK